MSREFEGRLNDLHTMLTNDAVTREANLLQHIQALIASNVGTIVAPVPTGPHILPTVATVSTGPQISFNLAACQSNAKASQCQVEPELSQSVLNKSRDPARPILTCGSEYNISYPPQTINNIPAESISPSSSQRAAREQSSAHTPRIERVGEYSNENTSSSPPQNENFVKR